MIADQESMPWFLKLGLVVVVCGVLVFPIWKAHVQTRVPRRRRDPHKPREVSQARLRKMWVVDRDGPGDRNSA